MAHSADYWIQKLQLSPHPEGGYFREIYRDQEFIPKPLGFSGKRNISTAIYYLLEKGDFSCFHQIKSDEMWHHYQGGAIHIYYIKDEKITTLKLGKNLDKGQLPMHVVPKDTWFAAEAAEDNDYALVGCTVAPGFDFDDFRMAKESDFSNHPLKNSPLVQRLLKK